MAKISVLIPVYNAEAYLSQCLDSIQKQTFHDFEVLMIDDGSQDLSGKICNEYVLADKRFHVRHQENQGSGRTRNHIIDWAMETDSRYIVWIDSDDRVHPNYLEHLYQKLIEHPECDIAQCRYSSRTVEFENRTIVEKGTGKVLDNIFLLTEMVSGNSGIDFTVLWNKIYSKELFQNVRVKITDYFSGRMQDDVNILSQIYKCSRGCYWFDEKLYFYRIVTNSIQHKKVDKTSLEYLFVYRDLYLEYKETEFSSFLDYLSERILFDIAYALRRKKSEYVNYKDFYKKLKEQYKLLDNQIEFVCNRKDLRLLRAASKISFYSFRIYAILYRCRGKVKAHFHK